MRDDAIVAVAESTKAKRIRLISSLPARMIRSADRGTQEFFSKLVRRFLFHVIDDGNRDRVRSFL
jgi:hypothetical protein